MPPFLIIFSGNLHFQDAEKANGFGEGEFCRFHPAGGDIDFVADGLAEIGLAQIAVYELGVVQAALEEGCLPEGTPFKKGVDQFHFGEIALCQVHFHEGIVFHAAVGQAGDGRAVSGLQISPVDAHQAAVDETGVFQGGVFCCEAGDGAVLEFAVRECAVQKLTFGDAAVDEGTFVEGVGVEGGGLEAEVGVSDIFVEFGRWGMGGVVLGWHMIFLLVGLFYSKIRMGLSDDCGHSESDGFSSVLSGLRIYEISQQPGNPETGYLVSPAM